MSLETSETPCTFALAAASWCASAWLNLLPARAVASLLTNANARMRMTSRVAACTVEKSLAHASVAPSSEEESLKAAPACLPKSLTQVKTNCLKSPATAVDFSVSGVGIALSLVMALATT